jgi:hypothetical protein
MRDAMYNRMFDDTQKKLPTRAELQSKLLDVHTNASALREWFGKRTVLRLQ